MQMRVGSSPYVGAAIQASCVYRKPHPHLIG